VRACGLLLQERELSGLNLGTLRLLLWRERLRETLRALSPPPPLSDLTSLACLLARPGVHYLLLPLLLSAIQYNTSPTQHPYPSHPSLDSSLLPVPSAEPATTTPNGPSASDEPGLNHDPRGPPPLCCAAVLLLSSLLCCCCAAAVLLLTSPLHRPHHRAANWTPTLPGQPSTCNYRQPTCPQPNTSPDPSSVCRAVQCSPACLTSHFDVACIALLPRTRGTYHDLAV